MKISKIIIQNYRGFQNETIELGDMTVFVGENNTGKSSILDAIKSALGSQSWNEKFSRYDYHLSSSSSHAGDAGDILINIEISENKEDEWPDEIQQTLPDSIDIDEKGLRHFFISVKGNYNRSEERSIESKEFQTKSGTSKGIKANSSKCFSDFKKLLPVFFISSNRDFTREFQQKKGLFNTFLNSEVIPENKRGELETKLATLNNEVIDVLSNIKKLKDNLKKSMVVLSGTGESIVDIEPLPSDLNELIGKAGIILQNKIGIRLPLERHGSGAQSLSVLFLYEAFLSVLLTTEYDKFSEPILLIEEPEAHLHPSAVRLFWRFLENMPGQKIVTTHSGDIISNVPFSKIRRISGTTSPSQIKAMSDTTFDDKDKRFLRNFITYSRGELFFARCWLIVEGETEQAFFENLLNRDGFLDQKGIRIIQYTQMNLEILLKISDLLGMRWFLIADGDTEGQKYTNKAKTAIPTGNNEEQYIHTISEMTIEVHLMLNGYSESYTSKISPQTLGRVTGGKDTIFYFESVYKAIKDSISKPQVILEIVDLVLKGSTPPPLIIEIRKKLETI